MWELNIIVHILKFKYALGGGSQVQAKKKKKKKTPEVCIKKLKYLLS
jgi:hypothetical protein